MAGQSFALLGILLIVVAPVVSLAGAFEALGVPVNGVLYSGIGMALCTLVGVLYGLCRAWIFNYEHVRRW